MTSNKSRILSVIAGLAALPLIASADAEDRAKIEMLLAHQPQLISLDTASQNALAARKGALHEAELDQRLIDSGWNYDFEIIDDDGQEWDVIVDAQTGDVIRVRLDD